MRFLLLVLATLPVLVPDAAFAGPLPAPAPVPSDAGLAIAVTGSVTYKGVSAAAAAPVSPYMKLRVGDVVDVAAGGHLEVLYFGSGRRETWDGVAALVVGTDKGEAKSGQASAQDQGPSVGHSLENLPIMLRQAQTYQAGQTLVRSGGPAPAAPTLDEAEQAQVAEARTTYDVLRANAKGDDVFPEMYLVSVLLPLGLDAESQTALEKAVTACPTCEEPKALLEWVKGRRQK